jgi:outer membrane protein assembly factor BamE (lipoprotein component of BamABCDE complex)
MKLKFFTAPALSALVMMNVIPAAAQDTAPATGSSYLGKVDPAAFRSTGAEQRKLGATVSPSTVRMITPGVDKFSIYDLIGTPHFSEGISRRWNYVLLFPAAPGSAERVRCRMEIRFERPRGRYHTVVSEVVWQDQTCADLVASAS